MIGDQDNTVRITGTIVSAVTPGWWIIKDDAGRRHRVASPDAWRRGQRVVVVGGQVIGQAPRAAAPVVRIV